MINHCNFSSWASFTIRRKKIHKSEYIFGECCAGAAHKCGENTQRLAAAGVGQGGNGGVCEGNPAAEAGSKMRCYRCSGQQEACLALLQASGRAGAAHFKATPARREVLDVAGYKARRQTVNEARCKLPYAYV